MVLDKNTGATRHLHFYDLPTLLRPGDCLVLNDSRVLPARLIGHREPGGGAVEAKVNGKKEVLSIAIQKDVVDPEDVEMLQDMIVAAVNEPPEELLRSGKLREDLYYRLGVVKLTLPPLRERPGDILLLANYFIEQYNRSMKRNISGLSPSAAKRFLEYGWPGNIRQLRNAVEGAFAIARGELLTAEDLEEKLGGGTEQQTRPAAPAPPPEEGISLSQAVERYEKGLIQQAMKRCGSISATARSLGLSRQNLKYKLQKYNL